MLQYVDGNLLIVMHSTYVLNWFFFSPKFSFDAHIMRITVKSESNDDPQFGPTQYIVTFQHAPGGRLAGKGRKDKIGCDVFFSCECGSYKIHSMCKHIGAICVVHLS